MDHTSDPAREMTVDDDHGVSFVPPPRASPGDERMASRIAARLFPQEIPNVQRIAHYEIERQLGAGGMGVVLAAHDTRLDRRVAIKLLRADRVGERARTRLFDEARALAKLSHPNVVQVYEVGEFEGGLFVVMELVEGQNLQRWVRFEKPDRPRILKVYVDAGRGLLAVHEAGLVHRDFKPSNVLIGHDGQVKVADFGLALVIAPSTTQDDGLYSPSSPGLAGTPHYVAPEVFAGEAVSPRSDQFSFCVALWEALSGRPPFDPQQLAASMLPEIPAFAGPRWLRRALARGLAAEPEQRWPSLAPLLKVLERRPAQRRRRFASMLTLALGSLAFLAAEHLAAEPSCTGGSELPGVWDAGVQVRVTELLDSPATGVDPSLAQTISDELGAFATRWQSASSSLCEARRGDRSAADAAMGERCLRTVQSRVAVLVEQLLDGAPGRMDRVGVILDELPDPHACLEVSSSTVQLVHWLDEVTLEPIIRRDFDQALGLEATGRGAEAQQQLARLDLRLGDRLPDLHAEILLNMAMSSRRTGAAQAAYDTLRRALPTAHASGRSDLVARVLIEFAQLATFELEDPVAARVNLDLGRSFVDQLGAPSSLDQLLLIASADLARFEGDYELAQRDYAAVLDRLEATGDLEVRGDQLRVRLAHTLAVQGELEQALALYQAILVRQAKRLGSEHPQLASLEFDIGATLFELGQWTLAHSHLQRAAELHAKSHPEGSNALAHTLTLLASTETELGRCGRGIELAKRAAQMQSWGFETQQSLRDNNLRVLAWAELQCEDFAAALATHEALLSRSPTLAEQERYALHETISWLLCRLGRVPEAEVHAQTALLASELIVRWQALLTLAEVELDRDRGSEALRLVDRVLRDLPADADPHIRVRAHWIAALAARRANSGVAPELLLAHEQAVSADAERLTAVQRQQFFGEKNETKLDPGGQR